MAFSMAWAEARAGAGDETGQARGRLAGFRRDLYWCLGRRRDALFEVADAVLCGQERVLMLAELSLEPECRRGHGAVYDALNCGEVHFARLRRALPALPLPAWDDGRIRLAVDVSNWLRPDAEASPQRLFCHCYARGKGNAQMIPGWPYSWVAALSPGRTSWTLPLDAVRLGPADDATEVTAAQVRDVVTRIIGSGQWKEGDPDIIIVFDAGYDLTRLAWLLAGLPADITGRLRSDRVMHFPAPPLPARPASHRRAAAPARAQARVRGPADLAGPGGHHRDRDSPLRHRDGDGLAPAAPAAGTPRQLGRPRRRAARHRGHPHPARRRSPARPARRGPGMAVVLPRRRHRRRSEPGLAGVPAPLRYRAHIPVPQAAPRLDPPETPRPGRRRPVDLAGYRLLRPAVPRPAPSRRHPAALAAALPARPATPARVRRGFRRIRQALPVPASAPKPARPGPGRPPGSKNRRPATRHDVGKTVKREEPKKKTAGRQVK